MFNGQDDVRTIDLVTPCELHLLLGPVNHLLEELRKVWPDADFWVAGCHAYIRGQDHGKLNDNGCNQLLKEDSLVHLESLILEDHSKFASAFRAFAKVKKGCYSFIVSKSIKEDIQQFREIYLTLNRSVTPKVHIVFEHLYSFLEERAVANNGIWKGLAMYSEQAFKAVHADFKKRWERFKVNPDNESYDQALLQAVTCYNSLNIY